MATMIYVSHPEVTVDPAVLVPNWGLSPLGAARMRRFAETSPLFSETTSIWSSTERKAIEAADILSRALSLPLDVHAGLGENERWSTGYVAPPRFWELVEAFFARPDESVEGWETARAAQTRIRASVAYIAGKAPPGDVALIAHGGVGALLLASLYGQPISRQYDQTRQGNWFAFDRDTFSPLCPWAPLPEADMDTVR